PLLTLFFPYTTLFRSNPQNLGTVDDLRNRLKRKVTPFFCFKSDVVDAINRAYDVQQKGDAVLAEIATDEVPEEVCTQNELEALGDRKSTRLNSSHVKI